MMTPPLPRSDEMMRAFMERDDAFEGVFFTGVVTTGIFCRTTCTARKPKPENVRFFATTRDALFSGFRPCKRCRPLEESGATPDWIQPLLEEIDRIPERRWKAQDLRDRGLSPERVRRWFKQRHGMTFMAYARSRRLGLALEAIREGSRVTDAALDHGYDSLSGFGEAARKLLGDAPSRAEDPVLTAAMLETPLGPMIAVSDEDAICLLEFADRRMLETQFDTLKRRLGAPIVPGQNEVLRRLERELREYVEGTRQTFEVPIRLAGTPFQETVWRALIAIPFGSTTSYGALARTIGQPTAVRAVANANGDNRLAILIPCHRVIGSDGSLTGYGGGLWRKRRLLDHETGLFKLGSAAAPMATPAAQP